MMATKQKKQNKAAKQKKQSSTAKQTKQSNAASKAKAGPQTNRNGKSKKYYQLEFRTPGWEQDRFSMSSGVQNKKVRDDYLSKLRRVFQRGEFELLKAVKDRKIALAVFASWIDQGGIEFAAQQWRTLQAAQAAISPELIPLLAEFIADPNAKASKKTLNDYERQVTAFIDFAHAELNKLGTKEAIPEGKREPVRLEHFVRDRVSKWVRHLEEAGSHRYVAKDQLSTRTVVHHRASLSAFGSWLAEEGHLEVNPVTKSYRPKVVAGDPKYMTKGMWALFRAESEVYDVERKLSAPAPDTLFWKFLVATGATTYNEGCAVQPAHIHIDQDPSSRMVRVWLPGTKTTNRPRSVWIPRSLAEELLGRAKHWKRGHQEPIFQFDRNDGYYVFTQIVKRLVRKGHNAFTGFNPYTLRHTYAVAMITGDPERGIPGVDIVTLARLLGHGDNIGTTMIYARHVADHAARGSMNMASTMGLDQ
jgi:integrase